MTGESPALYLWLAALLVPLLPALSLATALLERSGPIRMRHWVEEAGGSLRRLWEEPRRFAVYRYLLNLLANAFLVMLEHFLLEGQRFKVQPDHRGAAAQLVNQNRVACTLCCARSE